MTTKVSGRFEFVLKEDVDPSAPENLITPLYAAFASIAQPATLIVHDLDYGEEEA